MPALPPNSRATTPRRPPAAPRRCTRERLLQLGGVPVVQVVQVELVRLSLVAELQDRVPLRVPGRDLLPRRGCRAGVVSQAVSSPPASRRAGTARSWTSPSGPRGRASWTRFLRSLETRADRHAAGHQGRARRPDGRDRGDAARHGLAALPGALHCATCWPGCPATTARWSPPRSAPCSVNPTAPA